MRIYCFEGGFKEIDATPKLETLNQKISQQKLSGFSITI